MTTEQLEAKIMELEAKVRSLEAFSTISFDTERAFRERLGIDSLQLKSSSKAASSENQAVNEGGIASYDVLKPPDAFLEVTISGTIYYIPIFT